MKQRMLLFSAALLLLTGCSVSGGRKTEEMDLEALYAAGAEACGWTEEEMTDVEGELLEAYYPGLSGVEIEQMVAKVPAMSADVNEIVLLQCGTADAAEDAAAILQARVDSQIQDGAWYAESREAWENAEVLQQGTFAAMIASSSNQAEWESRVEEAFAQ